MKKRSIIITTIISFLILVFLIGIIIWEVSNPEVLEKTPLINTTNTTCSIDNDCQWVSTNCCPESSGAHWECINPDLSNEGCRNVNGHIWPPEGSGCYEFISEKPTNECKCVKGFCGALK